LGPYCFLGSVKWKKFPADAVEPTLILKVEQIPQILLPVVNARKNRLLSAEHSTW